jgi:hypothetical protein
MFRSRHYEIISMQLYSLRALQKYQECTLISIDFVEFSMKNIQILVTPIQ